MIDPGAGWVDGGAINPVAPEALTIGLTLGDGCLADMDCRDVELDTVKPWKTLLILPNAFRFLASDGGLGRAVTFVPCPALRAGIPAVLRLRNTQS